MMGVSNDRDISEYVLYDADDTSRLSNEIWNVLFEAFDKNTDLFAPVTTKEQDELLLFVGN
jgi:hypothetical protein